MVSSFTPPIPAIERFLKPFILDKEDFDYGNRIAYRLRDKENDLFIIEIVFLRELMNEPYSHLLDIVEKLKKQLEDKIHLAKQWEWKE